MGVDLNNIISIISLFICLLIIIVYFISFLWNIKSYRYKTVKNYRFINLYLSISCLVVSLIYVHLFVTGILNNASNISVFDTLIVKPSALLLGGAIASHSRIRYLSIKRGGAEWMFREHKS